MCIDVRYWRELMELEREGSLLCCVCRYIRWLNWRASGAINRHRGETEGWERVSLLDGNICQPIKALCSRRRFATKPLMARAPLFLLPPPPLSTGVHIDVSFTLYIFLGLRFSSFPFLPWDQPGARVMSFYCRHGNGDSHCKGISFSCKSRGDHTLHI